MEEPAKKVQAKFRLSPAAHQRIKDVAAAEKKTASQLVEEVALGLEPMAE
jgi:predicted HicB family RNase H-like nuclease